MVIKILLVLALVLGTWQCNKETPTSAFVERPKTNYGAIQIISPTHGTFVRDTTVTIEWATSSSSDLSYYVLLDTLFPPVDTVAAEVSETSYVHSGLHKIKQYFVRIIALAGDSTYVSETTKFLTPFNEMVVLDSIFMMELGSRNIQDLLLTDNGHFLISNAKGMLELDSQFQVLSRFNSEDSVGDGHLSVSKIDSSIWGIAGLQVIKREDDQFSKQHSTSIPGKQLAFSQDSIAWVFNDSGTVVFSDSSRSSSWGYVRGSKSDLKNEDRTTPFSSSDIFAIDSIDLRQVVALPENFSRRVGVIDSVLLFSEGVAYAAVIDTVQKSITKIDSSIREFIVTKDTLATVDSIIVIDSSDSGATDFLLIKANDVDSIRFSLVRDTLTLLTDTILTEINQTDSFMISFDSTQSLITNDSMILQWTELLTLADTLILNLDSSSSTDSLLGWLAERSDWLTDTIPDSTIRATEEDWFSSVVQSSAPFDWDSSWTEVSVVVDSVPSFFNQEDITFISLLDGDSIAIGFGNGFSMYTASNLTEGSLLNTYYATLEIAEISGEILGDTISTVAIDSAGALWMGTTNGGLSRLFGNSINNFWTGNSALPSNQVHRIQVSPDGKIWVATSNGLLIFRY